jgi:hypothetical protein
MTTGRINQVSLVARQAAVITETHSTSHQSAQHHVRSHRTILEAATSCEAANLGILLRL